MHVPSVLGGSSNLQHPINAYFSWAKVLLQMDHMSVYLRSAPLFNYLLNLQTTNMALLVKTSLCLTTKEKPDFTLDKNSSVKKKCLGLGFRRYKTRQNSQ